MTIIHSPFPSLEYPRDTIWNALTAKWDSPERKDVVLLTEYEGGKGADGNGRKAQITFGEFKLRCQALGEGMRTKLGLQKGDVVGILGANSIDWFVVVLAVQFAGLRSSLANPLYSPGELKHVFGVTEPRVVFCDANHASKVRDVGFSLDQVYSIGGDKGQAIAKERVYKCSAKDVSVSDEQARKAQAATVDDLDDAAYYTFSSGTTGPPKAVRVSHINVNSMLAALQVIVNDQPYSSVVFMPVFHAAALLTCLSNFLAGGTVHLLTPFDPYKWAEVIERENVDLASLVPPVLALVNSLPNIRAEQFKSIKWISCGTSPLDAKLEKRFSDKLGGVWIRQGYGMSESTIAIAYSCKGSKVGSVGRIVPNLQVRVVDPETGKDAEKGKPGELLVRGPSIVKGYFKNEKATREAIDSDQFLHTGDMVVIDDDGDVFIVDRLKELIKYKGFQVAPAELEGVLKQHPRVRLAGVIGVWREEEATEVPRAYVDLIQPLADEGQKRALEAELADFVNKQVSGTKRLRGGVKIIEAVPASPSGKILRRELKELHKKEASREAKL